ncbi:unnamed protein product [Ectocarpus sp. 13 AM-2016]
MLRAMGDWTLTVTKSPKTKYEDTLFSNKEMSTAATDTPTCRDAARFAHKPVLDATRRRHENPEHNNLRTRNQYPLLCPPCRYKLQVEGFLRGWMFAKMKKRTKSAFLSC